MSAMSMNTTSSSSSTDLQSLLGDEADALLGYTAKAFPPSTSPFRDRTT